MKVLISPGYGAGWSTWNYREMATDKDLIELFEKGCTKAEMATLCVEKGYEDPYMGGFDQLAVAEVPSGVLWRVDEYDGSESIEIFDSDSWSISED